MEFAIKANPKRRRVDVFYGDVHMYRVKAMPSFWECNGEEQGMRKLHEVADSIIGKLTGNGEMAEGFDLGGMGILMREDGVKVYAKSDIDGRTMPDYLSGVPESDASVMFRHDRIMRIRG